MYATDGRELPPRIKAIQKDLEELGKLAAGLPRLQAQREDLAMNEQAALTLLRFYGVCEHLLMLIDREVRNRRNRHVDWHSRLVQESEVELPGLRPAILTTASRRLLQKLLAFRNLERNIYGYMPAPYVIEKLSDLVLAQQPQLSEEFLWFLSFLQQRAALAANWPATGSHQPSSRLRFILPNA